MSIYIRKGDVHYSYDFRLEGRRYSGKTETSDPAAAQIVENQVRAAALGLSVTVRAILRKARAGRKAIRIGTSYVYMLRSGDYFIKIGQSRDPAERFKTIQTATPDQCEVLFCLPGDLETERALHAEFAGSHYRGEWFFLCGKLKDFVGELQQRSVYEPLLSAPRVSHDPSVAHALNL